MEIEKLEKQVKLWTRAAIIIPTLITIILAVVWYLSLLSLETLFFVACGMYFGTAIIWWWWTMKSIHLLVEILKSTNHGIIEVSDELKTIRKELQVDNIKDN